MADEQQALGFLKRRFARAIESGDDETSARLRLELDLLMNGRLARTAPDAAPLVPGETASSPGRCPRI